MPCRTCMVAYKYGGDFMVAFMAGFILGAILISLLVASSKGEE